MIKLFCSFFGRILGQLKVLLKLTDLYTNTSSKNKQQNCLYFICGQCLNSFCEDVKQIKIIIHEIFPPLNVIFKIYNLLKNISGILMNLVKQFTLVVQLLRKIASFICSISYPQFLPLEMAFFTLNLTLGYKREADM